MAILTPQEHFGFRLGDDRKLARWPKIVEYFELLARESTRVRIADLGKSTLGNRMIAAII